MISCETKQDRKNLVKAVEEALKGLIKNIEAVELSYETTITVEGTDVKATIFAEKKTGKNGQTPMIHWHSAKRPLKTTLPGAWNYVNQFHHKKATLVAESWDAVVAGLKLGMEAAKNGTAFTS